MPINLKPRQKKKIALAMAGAGARAVMYFGILDVFKEHGIEIDMISACSSATFVACSYACGTLDALKKRAFELDQKELFDMFEPSKKGGIFSLDKVEQELSSLITVDDLEQLPIPVSIVASDIVHGEEVVFTMGNIARAIKASCSMPGLFEPVVWGNKILLDGGLFSIIPVEAAKAWKPDIIIGIDLATSRNLFGSKILSMKRNYNRLAKPIYFVYRTGKRLTNYLFPREDDPMTIDNVKTPNVLQILDRAMDYALIERKRGEYFSCDVVITPDVKGYGDIALKKTEAMYMEGRRAAEMAIPEIQALLNS
ncbi:MAG: Patatin [Candidatus Doudnabacteria bacterium]|nr:Patatin [Candidatus Doudnabacteria bacterium]